MPLQWRNQLGQSLEKGAGNGGLEFGTLPVYTLEFGALPVYTVETQLQRSYIVCWWTWMHDGCLTSSIRIMSITFFSLSLCAYQISPIKQTIKQKIFVFVKKKYCCCHGKQVFWLCVSPFLEVLFTVGCCYQYCYRGALNLYTALQLVAKSPTYYWSGKHFGVKFVQRSKICNAVEWSDEKHWCVGFLCICNNIFNQYSVQWLKYLFNIMCLFPFIHPPLTETALSFHSSSFFSSPFLSSFVCFLWSLVLLEAVCETCWLEG